MSVRARGSRCRHLPRACAACPYVTWGPEVVGVCVQLIARLQGQTPHFSMLLCVCVCVCMCARARMHSHASSQLSTIIVSTHMGCVGRALEGHTAYPCSLGTCGPVILDTHATFHLACRRSFGASLHASHTWLALEQLSKRTLGEGTANNAKQMKPSAARPTNRWRRCSRRWLRTTTCTTQEVVLLASLPCSVWRRQGGRSVLARQVKYLGGCHRVNVAMTEGGGQQLHSSKLNGLHPLEGRFLCTLPAAMRKTLCSVRHPAGHGTNLPAPRALPRQATLTA
jgi:hypothetical protein